MNVSIETRASCSLTWLQSSRMKTNDITGPNELFVVLSLRNAGSLCAESNHAQKLWGGATASSAKSLLDLGTKFNCFHKLTDVLLSRHLDRMDGYSKEAHQLQWVCYILRTLNAYPSCGRTAHEGRMSAQGTRQPHIYLYTSLFPVQTLLQALATTRSCMHNKAPTLLRFGNR